MHAFVHSDSHLRFCVGGVDLLNSGVEALSQSTSSLQSLSTTFDGIFWGEAPNIPGTHGTNDNGANVFKFYDNFAGTTLSNKWTTVKSSGGSVAVNNRANFTTSTSSDWVYISAAPQAYPQVAESLHGLGGRRGCRARGVTYFVTETVMSRSTTDQFSLFTVLEKVFSNRNFRTLVNID